MYQPPGKLERVMGIEATPVAWDKLRQWLLPASCRCVLEGLLLAYSVEKLGFPQRALFRLPRIESDNCGQVFAEAILEDSRKTIAVGR